LLVLLIIFISAAVEKKVKVFQSHKVCRRIIHLELTHCTSCALYAIQLL